MARLVKTSLFSQTPDRRTRLLHTLLLHLSSLWEAEDQDQETEQDQEPCGSLVYLTGTRSALAFALSPPERDDVGVIWGGVLYFRGL